MISSKNSKFDEISEFSMNWGFYSSLCLTPNCVVVDKRFFS